MVGVSATCTVTCGNGVAIGTRRTTTHNRRRTIRADPRRARAACFAAAAGASTRGTAGRRFGSATRRTAATTTSASGWPQFWWRSERRPDQGRAEARAEPGRRCRQFVPERRFQSRCSWGQGEGRVARLSSNVRILGRPRNRPLSDTQVGQEFRSANRAFMSLRFAGSKPATERQTYRRPKAPA